MQRQQHTWRTRAIDKSESNENLNCTEWSFISCISMRIFCCSDRLLQRNKIDNCFKHTKNNQGISLFVISGCRASALNLEAKSLNSWKTSRHCIVTRFQDLSLEQFREIRSKAGGLIVLLPDDISLLTLDEKQVK